MKLSKEELKELVSQIVKEVATAKPDDNEEVIETDDKVTKAIAERVNDKEDRRSDEPDVLSMTDDEFDKWFNEGVDNTDSELEKLRAENKAWKAKFDKSSTTPGTQAPEKRKGWGSK